MQFLEKTLDCIGSTQKEDEKVHIETYVHSCRFLYIIYLNM